ncbi:MAG: sensor domain-containing diguanylate cyclase [Gammaproteobacteria bacterium]|nr:sensor domain-containing diguanylate cyclase [Gammaproteobacteria bacterium]
MMKPPLPLDETVRLKSLHSLRILDTEPEERFDRITRMAKRIFDVDICLVSLVDANRQWFKSKQGLEACETSRDISFCGHAILDEEIFVVEDALTDPRFAENPLVTENPHIRFYAGCPIHGPNGQRIGTLCLIDRRPGRLNDDNKEILKDFAKLVEDELAVLSQSAVDDLTGVSNRLGFNTIARHMLSLCRRTGTKAELVFFDLDGFKDVNDSFGHGAGDKLLKLFGKLLTRCFRSSDVIARLGGDEFVVLLTGTDQSEAALERLAKITESESAHLQGNLAWSAGKVTFDPERHETLESMLAEADSKMYEKKVQRRLTGS